ncbi:hypothetical protein AGMMS49975_13040 [Clostridia bacterium]|nr:hypothetical protein AGMMS49975_13040 [Clostridia bacterium]
MRRILLALLLTVFFSTLAFADSGETIRIGLEAKYKNASEVPLGDKTLHVGFGNFNESAVIHGASFSVVPTNMYYLRVLRDFNNYGEARGAADEYAAQGVKTCVALLGDNLFAVYFGGYKTEGDAPQGAYPQTVTLPPDSRRVCILEGGEPYLVFDNPSGFGVIRAENTTFVGTREYRGVIELYRNENGITPVNVVDFEQYLYSVVPGEMPSGWNAEALKAQAVVARTYALYRSAAKPYPNYDLCDISCQVYNGAAVESQESTAAVVATRGVLVRYNGAPIEAVFSASNGGVTAASADVWGGDAPYLQSIETTEQGGLEWVREYTTAQISSMAEGKGYSIGSVLGVTIGDTQSGRVNSLIIQGTNGAVTLEKEQIRSFFSSDSYLPSRLFTIGASSEKEMLIARIHNNTDIALPVFSQVSDSSVCIVSTSGMDLADYDNLYMYSEGVSQKIPFGVSVMIGGGHTVYMQKPEQAVYANTPLAPLDNNKGATVSGAAVVFVGRGNGHGAGMSQWGAKSLADSGFNYKDILKHYYANTEVY